MSRRHVDQCSSRRAFDLGLLLGAGGGVLVGVVVLLVVVIWQGVKS